MVGNEEDGASHLREPQRERERQYSFLQGQSSRLFSSCNMLLHSLLIQGINSLCNFSYFHELMFDRNAKSFEMKFFVAAQSS